MTEKPPLPLIIRPATDADMDFVRSTWTIGLRKVRELSGLASIDPEASLALRRSLVERSLSRPGVRVEVARLEGSDVIVGCVVMDENDMLWLYVKRDFRNAGAGERLMGPLLQSRGIGNGLSIHCATWTPAARKLADKWQLHPAVWMLGRVKRWPS